MGDDTEACEARRHADNVGYLAGQALQGILAASDSKAFAELGFGGIVNLAAEYGEALAKRLDNPPAED